MALFLLLIIVAIALGIIGAVVKGLLYLLIIAVVVLLADFIFLGARLRGAAGRSRCAPCHVRARQHRVGWPGRLICQNT